MREQAGLSRIAFRKVVVGLAAGALCLGALAGPSRAGSVAPTPGSLTSASGKSREVMLPNGDRVQVAGTGEQATVTPAPRGDGSRPGFLTSRRDGNLYAIPEDVLPRLTDPEPYNVTRLAGLPRSGTPRTSKPESQAGEPVELRVKAIGRDGRPARGLVRVFDVENGSTDAARRLPGDPSAPCTDAPWGVGSCIKLPPGTYSVLGYVYTMPSWRDGAAEGTPLNRSLVGDPEMKITESGEVVLDARKAQEVKIETPGHTTKRNMGALASVRWHRAAATGAAVDQGFDIGLGDQIEERLFIQPTERVRTGKLEAYSRWRLEAPAITMTVAGQPRVRLDPDYYERTYFSDVISDFPRLEGRHRLRLADAGLGRPQDIAGKDLRGRLALVQRSDTITVAEQSNNAAAAGAKLVAVYNDRPGRDIDAQYGTRLKAPTVHLPHEQGRRLIELLGSGSVTINASGITASPYRYELLYAEKQRLPASPRYVARTSRLGQVRNVYHSQLAESVSISTARFHFRPWETASLTRSEPLTGAPRTRVDYVAADPETRWTNSARTPETRYNNMFPRPKTPDIGLTAADLRSYEPGERDLVTWFKQPLTSGLNPRDRFKRNGDQLWVPLQGWADADRNHGDAESRNYDGGRQVVDFRLYRGADLIAQTNQAPRGYLVVPPDEHPYRMTFNLDMTAPWAKLSTRTRTEWTFRSGRPADGVTEMIPLVTAHVDADLDARNRARSRLVRIKLRHQDGAPRIPFRTVSLAASYDDGATWTDVRLRGSGESYLALLPRGGKSVSLRVRAEDVKGNSISQETIRAYEFGRV